MATDPLATYGVSDLAALLQVSRRFVDEEIVAAGRIAYVRVGPRTRRFTTAQVQEFLDRHTVRATPDVQPLRLVIDAA